MSNASVGHHNPDGSWSEPIHYNLEGVAELERAMRRSEGDGVARALSTQYVGVAARRDLYDVLVPLHKVIAGNPGIFLHGLRVKQYGDIERAFTVGRDGGAETVEMAARRWQEDTRAIAKALADGKSWLTRTGAQTTRAMLRALGAGKPGQPWFGMPDPETLGDDVARAVGRLETTLRMTIPEAHEMAMRLYTHGLVGDLNQTVEHRIAAAHRRGTTPDPVTGRWPDANAVQEARDEVVALWRWDQSVRARSGVQGPGLDGGLLRACGIDERGVTLDEQWPVRRGEGVVARLAGNLAGAMLRGAKALDGVAQKARAETRAPRGPRNP